MHKIQKVITVLGLRRKYMLKCGASQRRVYLAMILGDGKVALNV
jgi:hypothetical protein